MNGENNKIVKSGFSSVLQIIVASITYIVIYAFVVMRLGKEQLGIWSIITAIPTVVSFLGSGVAGSLLRYVPLYVSKNQQKKINKIVFNGLLFNFLLGFILLTTGFVFAHPILKFMFGISVVPPLYVQLFAVSLSTFLINFLSSVALSTLDSLQKIVQKNKILIVTSILFCVLAMLLIVEFKLKGLLYAQLFQSLIVLSLGLYALRRTNIFKVRYLQIDVPMLRLFYQYGRKLQYISILNILFEPITKFFLNRYFGLGTVGIYDIVNRIISQLRMLLVNAIQVMIPFVAKETDNERILRLYQQSFRGALLLSFIIFGGLISAGFSIIYCFGQINTVDFQVILLYLAAANVINILSAPAYAIQMATGKLKPLTIAQLLSTGLNISFFLGMSFVRDISISLLPTFLAIGISSAYVIFSYPLTYHKQISFYIKEDRFIYLISLLFPFTCIFISTYYFNLAILIIIAGLHAFVMLWQIYRNEYLMHIIQTLIKKRNKV